MVGSAVATMVWSSAPRNIASMMPSTMVLISGWVSPRGSGSCSGLAGFGAALWAGGPCRAIAEPLWLRDAGSDLAEGLCDGGSCRAIAEPLWLRDGGFAFGFPEVIGGS